MMAPPINFKVYLSREDGTLAKPEVRRFGIDKEVVTDFQYLREKLQTIFPNIRGKRFIVCWKGKLYLYYAFIYVDILPDESVTKGHGWPNKIRKLLQISISKEFLKAIYSFSLLICVIRTQ